MTDHLFQRAVLFADAHFGRSADSPVANHDTLAFMDWMIDRASSWGADTCIFLGDYFHNRASVGVSSLDFAMQGLRKLSRFKRTIAIKGNHDIARRHSRDVSSLNVAEDVSNIEVIRDPLTTGNVTFLPWLVEDEMAMLPHLKSRYVFAHLETVGAMMNARVMCTASHHAVEPDIWNGPEHVMTGHFHQRQILRPKPGGTTVTYTGNVMPFDFSDANDAARGITLLEWGRDPIFEAWPEQPLYLTTTLSELLTNPAVLRPKMTVRATIDIDLEYGQGEEIRQTLIEHYGLRKVELKSAERMDISEIDSTDRDLHTVDEIVIDGLRGIDSSGLSSETLIDIFTSLPRR